MPRRGRYDKHELLPDARYNSLLVARFINKLMERGKKGTAEAIMYGTIEELERRARRPGLEVFEQALRNATPVIEVSLAAWVARPTRCRWRSRASVASRWRYA